MKITITPPAADEGDNPAPYVLAGNITKEGPVGLRQNGKRLLQLAEKYDKEDIDVFNRKNVRNTFEFQVKRVFTTVQEAELFILDHENAVPNIGTIEFQTTGDNGASTASRFMVGGVDSISLVEQNGAAVTHSYVLVGGKVLQARPS